MKAASIKEASKALGLSESAVRYRLHKGLLSGQRLHNERGKLEWHVDLEAAIQTKGSSADGNFPPPPGSIPPMDNAIAAVEVELDEPQRQNALTHDNQNESELINARPLDDFASGVMSDAFGGGRVNVQMIAEGLIRPLLEKLTVQTMQLAEKERVIEEQAKQLRLIPDLEQMAQREREAAECHQKEIDQLRNQISELASEKAKLSKMADQSESLAGELEQWRHRSDQQQREWEFQKQQLEALRAEIIMVQQEKTALHRRMTPVPQQSHEKRGSGNWFNRLLKILLD